MAVIASVGADAATLDSAVTRPLASTLMTGICVPLPMLLCAVVTATKVGSG
jgi:hypothetical protein